MVHDVDFLVIGAGQAGLAMGYYLGKKSVSYLLLDAHPRVGDSWRNRYDSLFLFTPRELGELPGLNIPGDPLGYPTKDEVADYLESYALHHNIPVRTSTAVERLVQESNGFRATTRDGEWTARNIVVATGPFQKPFIPQLPGTACESVYQVHSASYRNPAELQEGPVLVIGAGNSGVQIAAELTEGREVHLSASKPLKYLPLRLRNRSIFWWFEKYGIAKTPGNSELGQVLSANDPIIGDEIEPLISSGAVKLHERAQSVEGRRVNFADGSSCEVSNIIWATGYREEYSWLQVPGVFDEAGKVIHERGKTPVPGIYFLGLTYQHTRASSLLYGVGADAEYLASFF